jgi:hypothetical protein
MNKKVATGAFLIVIIAASVISWFVYTQISDLQTQNSELRNQLNHVNRVNITDFSSGGWTNPVGVAMMIDFHVTILNTGINDVGGVTLEIKRLNLDVDPFNITRTLGVLHAGETTEIKDLYIVISIKQYADEFRDSEFVATLQLGETILNASSPLQITERPF